MTSYAIPRQLTFDECLLVAQALLSERRPGNKPFSIGITTTSGRVMTIDSAASPVISEEHRDDVALAMVVNEETLSAVFTGNLDPNRPQPSDLLVVGGDVEQWANLIDSVAAVDGIGVRMWGRSNK